MSNYTLKKSIHKAYEWLYEIAEYADWYEDNHHKSIAVLRAVLHELRDHLPINELANFSAQLPLLVKGILFEEWHPSKTHIKERTYEEFAASIFERLKRYSCDVDVDEAIEAVFHTLSVKVSEGEVKKLIHILPKGIRVIFLSKVDEIL